MSTYVIIFIGFLVVVYFVSKFNQNLIDKNVENATANSQLPALGQLLGLHHENFGGQQTQNRTIMDMGESLSGEYQGVPIEIIMSSYAEHSKFSEVPLGYGHAYSYSMKSTITITVKNADNKKFQILPKSSKAQIKPIGVSEFDQKLMFSGDNILNSDAFHYFGKLGWMDLQLKGNKLVFNDSYYEHLSSPMKMLTATHPIWKITVKNTKMDINHTKEFIDKLIEFAQEAQLT